MTRRWHLEHEDGREWTWEEFGASDIEEFKEVVVDQWGEAYVIDNEGWAYLDHDYGDAEVVWDG